MNKKKQMKFKESTKEKRVKTLFRKYCYKIYEQSTVLRKYALIIQSTSLLDIHLDRRFSLLHKRQRYMRFWWTHNPDPPHSLQKRFTRPCVHILDPPHCLQSIFRLPESCDEVAKIVAHTHKSIQKKSDRANHVGKMPFLHSLSLCIYPFSSHVYKRRRHLLQCLLPRLCIVYTSYIFSHVDKPLVAYSE